MKRKQGKKLRLSFTSVKRLTAEELPRVMGGIDDPNDPPRTGGGGTRWYNGCWFAKDG